MSNFEKLLTQITRLLSLFEERKTKYKEHKQKNEIKEFSKFIAH